MENTATPSKKVVYKSESSIMPHEYEKPKANQLTMPTWVLIVVLFAAFFILKSFIYISDEKRHGK